MNRRGAKNASNKHVSLDELMPSQYELRELIESKDPNPETNVLRDESARRVREAMLKVAPLYRMVLVLHDMEGLNTADVARVTGLSTGNRARAAASRTADAPPTVGPHGVRPRAS